MMSKMLVRVKENVFITFWLLILLHSSHAQSFKPRDSSPLSSLSRQSIFSNAPSLEPRPQAAAHVTNLCNATNSDGCGTSANRPLVSGGLHRENMSATATLDALAKVDASANPAASRANLITRTSDAIYRALLGYFSHDDELLGLSPKSEDPTTTKTLTTEHLETTLKPEINETTRWPRSNKTPRLQTTAPTTKAPVDLPKSKSSERGSTVAEPVSPKTTRPPDASSNRTTSNLATSKLTAGSTSTTPIPKTTSKSRLRTTPGPTYATTPNIKTDSQPTLQPHLDLTSFRDEPHSGTKQTSTTRLPEQTKGKSGPTKVPTTEKSVATTTEESTKASKAATKSTTKPDQQTTTPSSQTNDHVRADEDRVIKRGENSLEYFSLLRRAFNNIYAVNELTYLNRTTRLVHEAENSEHGAASTGSLPAGASEPAKSFGGEREGAPEESDAFLWSTKEADQQAQRLQQQVATRDDIMLLCKLLHKQLENGSILAANGTFISQNGTNLLGASASNIQKQQRTTSSTTEKPRDLLREFLSAGLQMAEQQSELNETHDHHLLESLFSLEKRAANELSYEEAAQRLLQEIFNAGFRRKFAQQLNISAVDAANSEDSNSNSRPEQRVAPIRLKSWSRTITGGKGGRLKLTYWLVLPASDSPVAKVKVLDSEEAEDLLEELDNAFVQQAIEEISLVRPLVLVTPYKRASQQSESASATPFDELMPSSPSPNVLDDDLSAHEPRLKLTPKASGVKGFIERLLSGSFEENLQIYLIALIILLFLVVMCFSIPMICCKSCSLFGPRSESNAALTASSTAGRFASQATLSDNNQQPERGAKQNGRRARARHGSQRGGKHQADREGALMTGESGKKQASSISGALKLPPYVGRKRSEEDPLREYDDFDLGRTSGTINEAVWTKLSNSTSTSTKDRTRLMHDDGQMEVPIMRSELAAGSEQLAADEQRMKRFEWYTFEDKTTTRRQFEAECGKRDKQSQTLTDHLKMTKSVQTSGEAAPDERPFNLSFSDRLEMRNSDTLTKSELVMLKEKLIPIGRQQLVRTPAEPPLEDGANKRAEAREAHNQSGHDYVNQPTRHIDSSIDDSHNGLSKSLVKPTKLAARLAPASSSLAQDEQRVPKMRYLELPSKTQSKMEAIKSELGKLEALESGVGGRQASSGAAGSYRRYDVI